jgi:hypothetical protein
MQALAGQGLAEDGFIQRTFAINLAAAPRAVDELPDTAAAEAYERLIHRLLSFDGGPVVTLSEDAHAVRIAVDQWVDDVKTLTAPWHTALLQHLGKWTGFARLLLLFHAIECAERDQPLGRMVSGDTAKLVRDFMIEYLLPHQEYFYRAYLNNNRSAEGEEHPTHKITRYLLSHKCERVTLRDLRRSTHLDERTIKRAMCSDDGAEGLVACNWVGMLQSGNRGGGTTWWAVNPKIYERFAERAREFGEKLARTKQKMREAGLRIGRAVECY